MDARIDQLTGSAKIGTSADLCQRLARVKSRGSTIVPLAKSWAIE
jgi:hypothetical protein